MNHIDQTPRLDPVSTNQCPNALRGYSDMYGTCDIYALTSWGYCTPCWSADRVPGRWAQRVSREMERRVAP